jgi:Calcineurin-like phosphoesterase superfamily domain
MNRHIRVIGDVHGNMLAYARCLDGHEGPSIQIGDMGVGFTRIPDLGPNNKFIRGNHDSPALCKAHPSWVPDGHTEQGMMFIGGASSIDKQYRTENVDWWADEQLSSSELTDIIAKYKEYKPKLVFTHDGPECVIQQMFLLKSRNPISEHSRTRLAFDEMLNHHKPDYWFFGHWHRTGAIETDNTTFMCVGINEYVDVEF